MNHHSRRTKALREKSPASARSSRYPSWTAPLCGNSRSQAPELGNGAPSNKLARGCLFEVALALRVELPHFCPLAANIRQPHGEAELPGHAFPCGSLGTRRRSGLGRAFDFAA